MINLRRSGQDSTRKPMWIKTILLLSGLVLLASCATKPKQDYDVNYDFSTLKTFNQLTVKQTDDPLTA
ncbi:hypothetical protein, partial [Psychrobacter sp. CAL606-MNA-CIBAN-0158]|uniref:hypothetical protein n=1 Tax=Psychrobacter sp. CAL606-MNA-CIBAN-0158 TaxID=3140461 RepID=UPI00332A7057